MKHDQMRVLAAPLLASVMAFAAVTAPASADAPAGSAPAASASASPPAKPAAAPSSVIVFCAPGYPGNTVQAQPAMDAFARAVEKAAGWPAGKLGAVYHETEGGGLEALRKPNAAFAVTTLPFFLQDGEKVGLKARLMAERKGTPLQAWTLVAKAKRVAKAADLDGWELTSPAGFAPDFVRSLMAGWGALPATTKITFSPAPLGALRRVVSGENLVVLLEPEQVQALFPNHPFAKDLAVVAVSKPVPSSFVSTVGDRVGEADAAKILDALTRLKAAPEGAEALKTLRIETFVPVPQRTLDALRRGPGLKK